MIESKLKAKNCNRGQLFRHCWVSSARRLDFRRFLESGRLRSSQRIQGRSAGSFAEQRLVIEPSQYGVASNEVIGWKEMILKQNLDVLVPKYIETITFVFPFSRLSRHYVWFRVDVISNRRPRLPKIGRTTLQMPL